MVGQLTPRRLRQHNQVEYEAVSDGGGYTDVLKTRLVGGDGPDIIFGHGNAEIKLYAPAGNLLDLSGEPWVKTLTSSAQSVSRVAKKTYSLPLEFASIGLYYNEGLLQEAGLKVPQNYPEFVSALQVLKSKGKTPMYLPAKDSWVFTSALLMGANTLYRQNPDYDEALLSGKVKFDSAGWRTAFTRLISLGKQGYYDPALNLGIDSTQAMNEFTAGRAAFIVHGNWMASGVKKTNPALKFGFMAFPGGPAKSKPIGIVLGGVTLSVNAKSKNIQAARKYLAFWAQDKNLKEWLTSSSSFSPLKGGSTSLIAEMQPFAAAVADDRTINFPLSAWPAGFETPWSTTTVKTVFQGQNLTTALRGLDTEFNKK